MRVRWWVGVVGWFAAAGSAVGQPVSPVSAPARLAVLDVPPLGLPVAAEVMNLSSGTVVSRPLQPVSLPAVSESLVSQHPTEVSVLPGDSALYEAETPLPRSWGAYEYLLWWPKAGPVPFDLGGGRQSNPATSGGRFTFGSSLGEPETVGAEVTYLFTGTQTVRTWDAAPGGIDTAATDRLTGWEVTGVANLLARPDLRVNALAGYRYFMANEGLRLERVSWRPGAVVGSADQFDAHNRFHGGQLGLHADWTHGPVFVEVAGKIGLGQAVNVVSVGGQSNTMTPGFPFPGVRPDPTGILTRPATNGRFVHTGFAVLPEGTVKVGYRFRDRSRMYLGYNILYLSEAARPGDQVERPAEPASATGVLTDRTPAVLRTDFWVQGLIFGLEYRY